MRPVNKGTVAALVLAAAIVGTAVAQDQPGQKDQPVQGDRSAPQGTSPGWAGWSWGPRGMMGFMGGPGMMGFGRGPWMMGRGASTEAMCGVMADRIEGRLTAVKAELKVTDAQEALWNAYAVAARDGANTMIARCTTMMGDVNAQVSLPDRLDRNEQLIAAQLDAVRAMNKALKPFYGSLSDSQKKVADSLFWGPMGMM